MRNNGYLMLTKALNKKEFNDNSGFLPGLKFCISRQEIKVYPKPASDRMQM